MKSAIFLTTVITGLSIFPAKAQTQFFFGPTTAQNAPIIVVSPLFQDYPNYYPGTGFYQYSQYFLSSDQHLDFGKYDYLLSDDLVYDFPIVGNFNYK
ncbi:hypothetical protein [Acaryochloris sp. IP29b_bin.137]|uniref:hypothetical protein n=1 Tax=Acaryochloris sp. IP29b_bin.137 TaxID=2969217 RepID=UPI00261685DC|nr:hypothetical protein [Acaryochloris sp. IP29b_bin.137]